MAELDALTTAVLGVGVTADTAYTFGLAVLPVYATVFRGGAGGLAKVPREVTPRTNRA